MQGSRSLYSGTPSSKSRRGQAPSIFRVLYACIMEVVENFQGMYNWVCYAVGKIKKREPFNVQLPYLMQHSRSAACMAQGADLSQEY
eukprot:1150486-Pelagomonas_calceolata.AAC.1